MLKKHISLLLSLLLLCTCVLGAVSCGDDPDPDAKVTFDYLTEDLTPYVQIDPSVYESMTVNIIIDEVTDTDVEELINSSLVYYKSETASYNGEGKTDVAITLGDVVYLYYRGYTLDVSGNKITFSGGSNISSTGTSSEVEVGSMSFISGFESALLGQKPEDMVKIRTTGTVAEGDYLTVSYFVCYPDETFASKTSSLHYAAEEETAIDAAYGEGFYDVLSGMTYGVGEDGAYIAKLTLPMTSEEHGDGNVIYQDIILQYATDRTDEPLVATTYFPGDYREETLRGKTVYFDIYLDAAKPYSIVYETPELTDAFLTETAGITADLLSEYEGDTLTEKYENYVRAWKESNFYTEDGSSYYSREDYVNMVVDDAILTILRDGATYLSLPANALASVKQDLQDDLDFAYEQYGSYYGYSDIETFAYDYFADYDTYGATTIEEYFEALAEDTVKERLVFYYVIRQIGGVPDGETLKAQAKELENKYFEINVANNLNRDDYASDESYQKALDDFYVEMMEYYGEDYFTENVRYSIGMEALYVHTTINNTGRKNNTAE